MPTTILYYNTTLLCVSLEEVIAGKAKTPSKLLIHPLKLKRVQLKLKRDQFS